MTSPNPAAAAAGPDRPARPGATVVIFNPVSGSGADEDELRAAFDHYDVQFAPTTEDDPGKGQAADAVAAGAATIVACGGDGTVRAVLESVAGSDAVLGVVPLGTGNLLASNLGVPIGLDAVPSAIEGPTRRLDVASVNGERFAVMAGVGFDAAMIRDAAPTIKRRFGSAAYVLSAVRNVPAKLTVATLDVDGERVWAGRTAMVLVGNCSTVTGGLEVFPDGKPDDGVLDVAVLSAKRLGDWLTVFWRLLRSKPQPPDLVARFTGTQVRVTMVTPMPYELDGEDRPATTHLEFAIEPDSLSVRIADATTDHATNDDEEEADRGQ
jgi:diacylglycerol kinase (ATP)